MRHGHNITLRAQVAELFMGDAWKELPITESVRGKMVLAVHGRALAYSGELVVDPNCSVTWSSMDGGSISACTTYKMVK